MISRVGCIAALLLSIANLSYANDGGMHGIGGSIQRLKGEHRTIQMVREWVRMEVYEDHYDVKATFIFHNDGPAATVKMGFPESGGGEGSGYGDPFSKKGTFKYFFTSVDGKQVPAVRMLPAVKRYDNYKAYWVKSVPFKKDQTRTVAVKYRSRLGGALDNFTVNTKNYLVLRNSAGYYFTGGNWKKKVRSSDLVIIYHLPAGYIINTSPKMLKKANRYSYHWKNWEAEGFAEISYINPAKKSAIE